MHRIELICPVDGLTLGVAAPEHKRTAGGDPSTNVGEHIHVILAGLFECANGHRWIVPGGFVLERVK